MQHDLIVHESSVPARCPDHGEVRGNTLHRVYDSRLGKTYTLCGLCIDERVIPLVKEGGYRVVDRRAKTTEGLREAPTSGSDS